MGKSTVTPRRSSTVTVARPTWGNNVSLKHATKRATRTVVASHCRPRTSTTDIGGLRAVFRLGSWTFTPPPGGTGVQDLQVTVRRARKNRAAVDGVRRPA